MKNFFPNLYLKFEWPKIRQGKQRLSSLCPSPSSVLFADSAPPEPSVFELAQQKKSIVWILYLRFSTLNCQNWPMMLNHFLFWKEMWTKSLNHLTPLTKKRKKSLAWLTINKSSSPRWPNLWNLWIQAPGHQVLISPVLQKNVWPSNYSPMIRKPSSLKIIQLNARSLLRSKLDIFKDNLRS